MFTGDLSDFSLREVLQFLTSTSRSGVLQIGCDGSTAGIALHDGSVCLALLDIDGVGGLAARMVRSGAVDVERLSQVTARSDIDAIGKAIELVTDADDASAAEDVCLEHTCETLGWLTNLDQATFAFVRSAQLDSWPLSTTALDDVLAEVDERAAHWARLPGAVSDLTLRCSLLPDAADFGGVRMTADQWRVIGLVDGQRSIGDLIELSGLGHLETCTRVYELVVAELLELVAPGDPTTLAKLLDGLGVGVTPMVTTPLDRGHALPDVAVPSAAPSVLPPMAELARDEPADRVVDDGQPGRVDQPGGDQAAVLDRPPVIDGGDQGNGDANQALLSRLLGRADTAS